MTNTREIVLEWINNNIFSISDNGDITTKQGRVLKQRINYRNRSNKGDPRVDLQYNRKRISIHVSHLVWIEHTRQIVPYGFEIHHIDGDPTNNKFNNLLAVHSLDHLKLHQQTEEIPF